MRNRRSSHHRCQDPLSCIFLQVLGMARVKSRLMRRSCAVVGVWDWEDANVKMRANIYQEPLREAFGEPGRWAHPSLLDGSLCKDYPLISEGTRARGSYEAPGGPNGLWEIFQYKYLAGHGTSLEYKLDQRRSLLIARAPGMQMEKMTTPVCLLESGTCGVPDLTWGSLLKANDVPLWHLHYLLTTDCLCAAWVIQTCFYFVYKAFFIAVDRWRFSTGAGEARDIQGCFVTSTVLTVMLPRLSRLWKQ